jgi:hypothetical protein
MARTRSDLEDFSFASRNHALQKFVPLLVQASQKPVGPQNLAPADNGLGRIDFSG